MRKPSATQNKTAEDDAQKTEQLLAEVAQWIATDPDPRARRELQALLVRRDLDDLRERFAGPIRFGTAGLRGLLGAGPARMNEATVARASAGLASQVMADTPDAAARGVVIGRDGRNGSERLAKVAAEVLAGHGLTVHWFDGTVPTPLVAFAVRHLNAAAGIVVTASHNPPEYNGFKVYAGHGAQIVSPQDEHIREQGVAAGPVREFPRAPFHGGVEAGAIIPLGPEVADAWLDALDTQCRGPKVAAAPLTIVTTSMHGVGHPWLMKALARRGFNAVHPVPEQQEPDGAFPTVAFPNPEEPGALDLALALGRKKKADLILANDPDADRLCVAVASADSDSGYRVLTGNEVGVLLGDWLLAHPPEGEAEPAAKGKAKAKAKAKKGAKKAAEPSRVWVGNSVVSSAMLGRIAASYGAEHAETLTGFKWIWDQGMKVEADGARVAFGYEEALGYCVGPVVRDKDGIGAAQVLCELAAALGAEGGTLLTRLDDLARAHGLHVTSQRAVVFPGEEGKATMAAILEGLRAKPPKEIAGSKVTRSRDLAGPDAKAAGLPNTNMLTWWLKDGTRVIARPSGTEPKLKIYFEVRAEISGEGDDAVAEARGAAAARLEALDGWALVLTSKTPKL